MTDTDIRYRSDSSSSKWKRAEPKADLIPGSMAVWRWRSAHSTRGIQVFPRACATAFPDLQQILFRSFRRDEANFLYYDSDLLGVCVSVQLRRRCLPIVVPLSLLADDHLHFPRVSILLKCTITVLSILYRTIGPF